VPRGKAGARRPRSHGGEPGRALPALKVRRQEKRAKRREEKEKNEQSGQRSGNGRRL
jgi:hypothetical protein